jgi:protein disulfide-isomerase A6
MDYKLKYEKYKIKYFALKNKLNINNQNGGSSSSKPTLYLFKAEWCGHCKMFKDDWEKLQGNSELKKKVNFVTIDSDKNKKEIKQWDVQGFPTLILKTGDKAIEYGDNRTVENITEFLNKNTN